MLPLSLTLSPKGEGEKEPQATAEDWNWPAHEDLSGSSMMQPQFYQDLADRALRQEEISPEVAHTLLISPEIELLSLLNAAYQVRRHFTGKEVQIHIINNAQNGHCPEDCGYCAQAKSSQAEIEAYPMKSELEILAEAKRAYEAEAYRYCMVFAGRGPSKDRVKKLAGIIRKIKAEYPIEICVSAGLLDEEKAAVLKEAGLDRLNHNLNSSERHYAKICSTHTFQDRLQTLQAAQKVGLEICSGIIIGMGEAPEDVIEVASRLRGFRAPSIPVNFLVPIPGNAITQPQGLTPDYCLRVLCLFRFINPAAEIRAAAGRESHLRSLEVLCLYPANSLFLEGYLNTKGADRLRVLRMIRDAGFTIKADTTVTELLQPSEQEKTPEIHLKSRSDLRPTVLS